MSSAAFPRGGKRMRREVPAAIHFADPDSDVVELDDVWYVEGLVLVFLFSPLSTSAPPGG